jgi:hypothetical protein
VPVDSPDSVAAARRWCAFRTSLERRWELVPGWRSETPRSELLSEPLGRPRHHRRDQERPQPPEQPAPEQPAPEQPAPEQLGQARGRRLRQAREAVGSDRFPFILVGDKLNRRQPHCLECIKDVALDVEEHSREYEPWD